MINIHGGFLLIFNFRSNSRMLFERPGYYALIHILFGFIAAWFPLFGIAALAYQVGQYAFNVRVFPVEGTIRPGNTFQHTAKKIAEMGIGYSIGLLINEHLRFHL